MRFALLALAILAAPVAAQDRAPTVFSAVCNPDDPTAPATFIRVTGDAGGWPVFYLPAPLLLRGSCEDVAAVPPSDLRYQSWAPTAEVRERLNTGITSQSQ